MKFIFLVISILFASCVTAPPVGSLAVLFQCKANSNPLDGIVGGEKVPYGDPDQKLVVMLEMHRGDHETVCTGTLISDRVVLTAAHCVDGLMPDDVYVHFHTSDGCPVNQSRDMRVESIKTVIHSGFDGTPQSLADLSLVYLGDDAPKDQERIPLLKPGIALTSDKVLLIGFGITSELEHDSQTLRRIHKSWKEDISLRGHTYIVNQSNARGGFCRGDSGAPIIGEVWGEPFVVAVNSANVGMKPNTECQTMSLAMDTTQFSEWINRNQHDLESSTWLGRFFSGSSVRVE